MIKKKIKTESKNMWKPHGQQKHYSGQKKSSKPKGHVMYCFTFAACRHTNLERVIKTKSVIAPRAEGDWEVAQGMS